MAVPDLEKRVENIENTLTILNTLPARVGALESQFLQFRQETRDEFSAVHARLDAMAAMMATKDELHAAVAALSSQIRASHEDLVVRIEAIGRG